MGDEFDPRLDDVGRVTVSYLKKGIGWNHIQADEPNPFPAYLPPRTQPEGVN